MKEFDRIPPVVIAYVSAVVVSLATVVGVRDAQGQGSLDGDAQGEHARSSATPPWGYTGEEGPEFWASLSPE